MDIPFNLIEFLENLLKEEAKKNTSFTEPGFIPDVKIAEAHFGDFQANGVLGYAKKIKKNPRELGIQLLESLQPTPLFKEKMLEVELSGPGFLNFKLSSVFLSEWLKRYQDPSILKKAASTFYAGEKISIDYSSPNTAKQMHVGHMRSMIIGEAIQRMLSFCGAKVIRDNHLGDWGTQFGILIMAIKHFNYDLDAAHEDALEDLEMLYKKGNELFESDSQYQEVARNELVKLQQEEAQNFSLWKKITEVSYKAFQEIYDTMGVQFDVVLGESFYRDKVDRVYKELLETGVAQESQGALVVFHPSSNPAEKPYPMIIRKKDGASNYAATDLATALYHTEVTGVNQMVYVTDGRQQDHFKYLFATIDAWFKAKKYPKTEFRHVWFGTILGDDGKAIKTRAGTPVRLKELLSEAVQRAYKIVEEKNPDLPSGYKQRVAKVVGIGAIKYTDLVQNRTSDYIFNWDKILSFDGNTAPYLLYAVARIYSIFRKAEMSVEFKNNHPINFETPEEIALAKKIVLFPIILFQALEDLRPHFLCTYLYELAGSFSAFYNLNRVIVDDPKVRDRRLLLCKSTLEVLETGLHLLGLETLQEM